MCVTYRDLCKCQGSKLLVQINVICMDCEITTNSHCCCCCCCGCCRLSVLYVLTGILCVLLGSIVIRYVIWLLVWLPTGGHFWLLPNMLSEEVRISIVSVTVYFQPKYDIL